ncbi:hypothetical protein PV327_002845 [Microctonus hyperodae]|uniref:Uncharacterized protein n=1 Tax=Microctonus hyperodae TaxID=165561 RepID=A0AA39FGV5_MICHY|nr:hypothetical protein PV327_002845 [Microctonus hyperodae]
MRDTKWIEEEEDGLCYQHCSIARMKSILKMGGSSAHDSKVKLGENGETTEMSSKVEICFGLLDCGWRMKP